ncbi:MAG TPA: metallophosphoesterase [Humisphaera sp.]
MRLVLGAAAVTLAVAGRSDGQTIFAQPYVQPGPAAGPTGLDAKTILWLTDQTPGTFSVEYGWDGQAPRRAEPKRTAIDLKAAKASATTKPVAPPKDPDDPEANVAARAVGEQHYFRYAADLSDLPPDTAVWYRVRLGSALVREASFRTRSSADKAIRFVAVGDLANGKPGQDAVARQVGLAKPQFVVALGDIVYSAGRTSQYADHFWRTYTNPPAAAGAGAGDPNTLPLMATVPFRVVLGNHDCDTSLSTWPDALGAYYFFTAPANGPGLGKWSTPIGKDKADVAAFRAAAGDSYPALGFYSFDDGPAHFLVLDNNGYAKLDDPALLKWIESDLTGSKAPWKFVCLHAPPFHTSPQHYTDQKTRLLVPLFEKCGVDVVWAGHVHNYQRSHPLKFTPAPRKPGDKLVNGTFALDTKFDGKAVTKPDGVLYFVSGGGGGTLYKDPFEKAAESIRKKYGDGNFAPYTAKHVADRHSFVVCDLSPDRLTVRAVDADGKEFDQVVVTKR